MSKPNCTCPSGDGSLRWPCPAHPPRRSPEEDGGNGDDLARRLMDAARRDSLTQADRHAIGQAIGRLQSLAKQIHDLNWALGTEGYDKMHDQQDQADHEEAVRGTERFIQRMAAAAERQKALVADAAKVERIRKAIDGYHLALDTRQHGGVAMDRAFNIIADAMGMPWVPGAAARAAQAQGGAA